MTDRSFNRLFGAMLVIQLCVLAGIAYVVYAILNHFGIV